MHHILNLPHCKSIVIRQLVDHFVKTCNVLSVSEDESNDVKVVAKALTNIQQHIDSKQLVAIDVQDCGAAYRFLMALLAVTPGRWKLTGTLVLLSRPIQELVDVLTSVGADIQQVYGGWQIVGKPLAAQTLQIDCTRSSQFASALLLIAPKLGLRRLQIHPADFVSRGYVQLTQAVTKSEVEIPGLPFLLQEVGSTGDWSAAVYGYALARLHPEDSFELRGLSLQSIQGDAIVADWFSDLGIESEELPAGVQIRAVRNFDGRPRTYDVADHLDLVPVMATLAVLLPADFTFLHTENLKYKESNRLTGLVNQLGPYSQVIDVGDDTLRIVGMPHEKWSLSTYRFTTHHDHRLAMAFLLFGEDAILDDVACLCKSYPQLYDTLKRK